MVDPRPGETVHVRYRKWDGERHWTFDGVWLGRDEHGAWLGFPSGTRYDRPARTFDSDWDAVGLFPDAGWTPAFNAGHPRGMRVYIDLATVPEWSTDASSPTISMIDLDLDVVERRGVVTIDDEDEFAEHWVRYGYPDAVAARVRADALALAEAVARRTAPFDEATSAAWLDRLRELTAGRRDREGSADRDA